MNKEESKILHDFVGFLNFAIAENLRIGNVLSTLNHDIRGINEGDKTFLPRTSGYCKRCKICDEPLHGPIRVHHHYDEETGRTAD